MKKLMIYGAAGYTGSMAAEHASAAGVALVLSGRERDRSKLAELADRLHGGAEVRTFTLDEATNIQQGLLDVSVVLNAAGPFMNTAEPLMSAAIRAGVHYLDFSAELDTYREALALDGRAREANVMLLPGSGGSVVMLGSLAAHAVARVRQPQKISNALCVSGSMSRGSATSASQSMVTETLHLVNRELVSRDSDNFRDFDFGRGPQSSFPVTLPDLVTIHHATGVENIDTYVHVSAGAFPTGDLNLLPAGPSNDEREANRYYAAVEVLGADGAVVNSVLDAVNGYTFTSMAAAEAARRVLAGEIRPGFGTPVGIFGRRFATTIADTKIRDL